MSTLHMTQEPVVLEGYQSIFEPNPYGKHSMQCIIGQELVDALEEERPSALEWAKGKQKAKRYNTRLEPWEPVSEGKYKVTFRWDPEAGIPIVDSEGLLSPTSSRCGVDPWSRSLCSASLHHS